MEAGDLQAIKSRSDELMKASHKVAETMYAQAGAAGAGARGPGPGLKVAPMAGAQAAKPEEDVVEAEFEEVKDDKK